MMRQVPPEANASFTVSATADLKNQNADWKFNADATADFGDLTFKLNADALKKDSVYYFRINNIPSLLGASLASLKGEWIKIDPAASSTWPKGYSDISSLAATLPDAEKQYKENRAQLTEFTAKVVAAADEEHLFTFMHAPSSERVDGRLLYRYDLQLSKSALLPFYKKMVELSNTYAKGQTGEMFNDPGMIDYLQSDEFSQVFDYFNQNVKITIWVDPQGYPAVTQYSLRVVPPDSAVTLKNKQVMLVLKGVVSNINQPVSIETPAGAKPIQDVIKEELKNSGPLGL
jgi:hypothetical protein